MSKKFISEQDLQNAAATLRNTMLDTLPQNSEGEFSAEFEQKIIALKKDHRKQNERTLHIRRLAAVAAVFVLIVTMFFSVNTEARAAVSSWFMETFDTHSIFWFTGEKPIQLPVFELSDVPEKYECVYDETLTNSRTMLYVNPEDETDGFTFDYGFIQDNSPLTIDYGGIAVTVQDVTVNGCPGKLYISSESGESHALIWIDESNDVVFTMTSFLEPNVMLHIAGSAKLVK